jgi:hypothetical protein
MVAVMAVASVLLLGSKTSKTRFVLQYGLIYVGLLIPVRFWALVTLRKNRWGTRRLTRHASRQHRRQALVEAAQPAGETCKAPVVA